jgi:hypothetical protein
LMKERVWTSASTAKRGTLMRNASRLQASLAIG